MKHRGIKITTVKVTRYEVRHLDGKKMKTFADLKTAKAWIDGYLKAIATLAPRSADPEAKS